MKIKNEAEKTAVKSEKRISFSKAAGWLITIVTFAEGLFFPVYAKLAVLSILCITKGFPEPDMADIYVPFGTVLLLVCLYIPVLTFAGGFRLTGMRAKKYFPIAGALFILGVLLRLIIGM